MNRKDITATLSRLLERDVLANKYWASEVSFDLYKETQGRVDYLAFKPASQSTSGIEHGEFIAYEIKSCIEDYRSGNGLNFIGDKNYLVTTVETYKKLGQTDFGVYIAVPKGLEEAHRKDRYEFFENPTPLTDDINAWKLWNIRSFVYKKERVHSVQELLFCMIRSGR